MKVRIKEVCKSKGITLKEISTQLNIERETLSRSINGNITINRLAEIANILDVNISDLILEENGQLQGIVKYKNDYFEIHSKKDLENLLNQVD